MRNNLKLVDEDEVFGLLPFVAGSILQGSTLVVDELDAKIHPVLLKYIIQLYTDPDVNRHGTQLIFTSHDLSTMNNELFRRDEIWFVLHFANYTSNNHRSEYITFLDRKFKEIGRGKYEKNRTDIHAVLRRYGDEELAIRYAKRIIEENEGKSPTEIAPGTKVFELVEELRRYILC